MSKFVVLAAWLAVAAVLMVGFSLVLGMIAGVGASGGDARSAASLLIVVGVLSSLLGLPAGLAASVGRGYLPAIGSIIVVIAVSQVAVLFGTGGWFPFAVPGLLAVSGANAAPELTTGQFATVPLVTLLLIAITVLWWDRAESV